MTPISHALLVSPEEVDALLSGRSHAVRRSRPTELRMRVGLLRNDGALIATALLVDASRLGDGQTASEWTLHDLETLPDPIAVDTGDGPLWRRLDTFDRDRVAGRATMDNHGGAYAVRGIATVQPSEQQAAVAQTLGGSVDDISADERIAEVVDGPKQGSGASDEDVSLDRGVPEAEDVKSVADGPALARAAPPEGGGRDLKDAQERALAFVPSGMIDVDEAHRLLIRLRDVEIKRSFPDVRPEHGILRRTMLQALLDTGVASREDYDELIPTDLKRMTDRRQVEVYLHPLIEILSRVA